MSHDERLRKKNATPQGAEPQASAIAAFRDSEERLRAILETAVEGIITIDEFGIIESVNPAAGRLFGYSDQEMIGQNVKILMPPPYQEEHDHYLGNYRQSGHPRIIGIGREVIGRRKDGSQFPMDLSVAEAKLGSGRRFVGFVRDITSRKDAEKNTLSVLKELTDLKAALDAHSIVAITDATGRITYVNEKFCAISQYSREELIGKDHRIINSGYHPKSFFHDLWSTIARGNIWRGEIRNRAKDGSFYWVDTTIFPFLNDQGKPVQYIAIRTDITARKANEQKISEFAKELAETNKELETVVYIVSHDLRSPLINVQGFGSQLKRSCDKVKDLVKETSDEAIPVSSLKPFLDTIPKALHFIEAGVNKMDQLLSGFLRFSRLGRVSLNIQPLDMNRFIEDILISMRYQLDQEKVEVEVGPLPACYGDRTHTGQVFTNLLDNAIKYKEASRRLHIKIGGQIQDGRAVFSVEDNGMGIAAGHQSKIFEIFHRLHPEKFSGEGLGLTIGQRILERQNGKIWVESKDGQGTTFFVSLPAAPHLE